MSDHSTEQIKLKYIKVSDDQDIQDIYNFNVEIFSELADSKWTVEGIKRELNDNWELYSAVAEKDIVAALFIKFENNALYTKHTPIKFEHRGRTYSHQIKEFCEKKALELGATEIYNICELDNFRMISLNETHGYERTNRKLSNGAYIEWKKKL